MRPWGPRTRPGTVAAALRLGQSAGAPRGAQRGPSGAHAPAAGRQGGGEGWGEGRTGPARLKRRARSPVAPTTGTPRAPPALLGGGGGGQSTMAVSWRNWLANEGSKHLFLVGRCLGVGDGGAQPSAEGRRFPPAREVDPDPEPGGRAQGAVCPGAGSVCSLLALLGKVWGRKGSTGPAPPAFVSVFVLCWLPGALTQKTLLFCFQCH